MEQAARERLAPPKIAGTRLNGPDSLRFVAFCAVVVLHALGDTSGEIGASMVGNVVRFAVPFFFLLSGYFLSPTAPFLAIVVRTFRRLVPVFLIWLFIYMLVAGDLAGFGRPAQLARYLITGGPAYHLWFLPALGIGVVIVAATRRFPVLLVLLAVGLFVFGLAFGAYREVLHLPDLPIGSRNGPFFSVPFIALGYFAAQRKIPSAATGTALALAGLALQCAESFQLSSGWQTGMSADYFVGTVPFALGIVVLSFHLKNSPVTNWTAELGRTSLWMYCIHALILSMLASSMQGIALIVTTIGICVLTAALAAAVASRVPVLVPLVR